MVVTSIGGLDVMRCVMQTWHEDTESHMYTVKCTGPGDEGTCCIYK